VPCSSIQFQISSKKTDHDDHEKTKSLLFSSIFSLVVVAPAWGCRWKEN
jgi:hypothetical protein